MSNPKSLSNAAKSALRRFLNGGTLVRMRESVVEELHSHGFPIQCEMGRIHGEGRMYYPLLRSEKAAVWQEWCERASVALERPEPCMGCSINPREHSRGECYTVEPYQALRQRIGERKD